MPVEDVEEHYFELPRGNSPETLYGVSLRLDGFSPPAYVQVAFPSSDVVFDSVLEEFLQDIAWLWILFMLLMLGTNLLVGPAPRCAPWSRPSPRPRRSSRAGFPSP